MESISTSEKQSMVSSFLEIAVGQSAETARQFLQATSWKLEEAIQLFYVGNEGVGLASSSLSPPTENSPPVANDISEEQENDLGNEPVDQNVGDEEVRPPLPVRREVLYDDASLYRISRMGHPSHEASSLVAFRNFNEESKRPGVWESDQSSSAAADNPRDNLASLYRPPFALMYQGPFEKAKIEASFQDKWLLVNLQSTKEFSSHMVYDDTSEGRKVCTYYNLVSIPVVLVIDPITGQKMRAWNGMIQPDRLLEDLLPFMDRGPKECHVAHPHKRPRESAQSSVKKIQDEINEEEDEEILRALAASMESRTGPIRSPLTDGEETPKADDAENCSSRRPSFPPLPEEPKGERHLLCRVGIRLPDGRRVQRNFFNTDPIQYLWSFCGSQLKEAETRPFRLTQAIPGASKCLDYESKLTFGESGLSNSMITLTWE